jgi:N-acylneuraminate cytidylyltransferase
MVYGLLPARGGSKGIPRKNVKLFAGKPLINWAEEAMKESVIDYPWTATENDEIASLSLLPVYHRSVDSASDTAPTEQVMLEFLQEMNVHDDDIFVLCQATSPYTTADDINACIKMLDQYDTVLSVASFKRFIWTEDGPVNYHPRRRQRRQDCEKYYLENGAIYVSSVWRIKRTKSRISGDIGLYEQPYGFELDDEKDWRIGEELYGYV